MPRLSTVKSLYVSIRVMGQNSGRLPGLNLESAEGLVPMRRNRLLCLMGNLRSQLSDATSDHESSFPTRALFVPVERAVADFLAWRAAFDEVAGLTSTIGLPDSDSCTVAQAADLIARAHSYNTLSSGGRLELGSCCTRCSAELIALMAPSCCWRLARLRRFGNVGFIGRGRAFSGKASKRDARCRRPEWSSCRLVDAQCPIELARRLARWWPIELHEWRVGTFSMRGLRRT